MDNPSARVFRAVRPACVALSDVVTPAPETPEVPPLSALRTLSHDLKQAIALEASTTPEVILTPQLGDYIFVPLALLLGKQLTTMEDPETVCVMEIIALLLKHCWHSLHTPAPSPTPSNSLVLTSALVSPHRPDPTSMTPSKKPAAPSLSASLFPLVVILLGGAPLEATPTLGSDSLQVAAIDCLVQITAIPFSTALIMPTVGHLIAVLLAVMAGATHSSQLDLLLGATQTLRQVLFILIGRDRRAGDMLALVLPQLVSVTHNLLVTRKLHYTAVEAIMDVMTDLLAVVFDDQEVEVEAVAITTIEDLRHQYQQDRVVEIEPSAKLDVSLEPKERSQQAATASRTSTNSNRQSSRDEFFLKSSAPRVELVLRRIFSHYQTLLRNQETVSARYEALTRCLLRLAASVLDHSSKTLGSIVGETIDLWAFLHPSEGAAFLRRFGVRFAPALYTRLSTVWLPKLASLVFHADAEVTVDPTGPAGFYLTALNETESTSVRFLETVDRVRALIVEELASRAAQTPHTRLVETAPPPLLLEFAPLPGRDPSAESTAAPMLTFAPNVVIPNKEAGLRTLLRHLGSFGAPTSAWVDALVSHDSVVHRAIGLWSLTQMLEGSGDEFLCFDEDDSGWTDVLELSSELLQDLPPENGDSLVPLTIALDAIATTCSHLLVDDLQPVLIDLLFPLLDCLSKPSLQTHALRALERVATRCYPEGTLVTLVEQNADYLLDSVSLRLALTALTPSVATLLLVLVRVGKLELVAHMGDVLNSMFLLLDMYHGYATLCEGFFGVFHEIVTQACEAYGAAAPEPKDPVNSPWGLRSLDALVGFLSHKSEELDRILHPPESHAEIGNHPAKPFAEADSDDESDNETPEEEPTKEEVWDSPVPESLYYMLQRIFNYGIRLLTHPSLGLQNQILTVFTPLIAVLASSPKRILPVLAEAWPLLWTLFKNTNDLRLVAPLCAVFEASFKYGGSFMATRFAELWPLIQQKPIMVRVAQVQGRKASVTGQALTLNLPPYDLNLYTALATVLVVGTRYCGTKLSDMDIHRIVRLCLPCLHEANGLTDESFGPKHVDTVWFLRSKAYGSA